VQIVIQLRDGLAPLLGQVEIDLQVLAQPGELLGVLAQLRQPAARLQLLGVGLGDGQRRGAGEQHN